MIAFAELTSPQVAEVLAGPRTPVLLLPVGAVEPHGPHAPLATDQLISAGVCERAAERLTDDPDLWVFVLPAVHYGVADLSAAFPGGISIGAGTLRALLVDICASLAKQGFDRVVVVNNHFEPAHVAAVRSAVRDAGVAQLDLLRRANVAKLTDEFRSGSCHAGRYETSLVLADRPDLVHTRLLPDLPEVPVNMPKEMAAGRASFTAMGMDRAYSGAPADATADEGVSTFDTLTEMLVRLVREVGS